MSKRNYLPLGMSLVDLVELERACKVEFAESSEYEDEWFVFNSYPYDFDQSNPLAAGYRERFNCSLEDIDDVWGWYKSFLEEEQSLFNIRQMLKHPNVWRVMYSDPSKDGLLRKVKSVKVNADRYELEMVRGKPVILDDLNLFIMRFYAEWKKV